MEATHCQLQDFVDSLLCLRLSNAMLSISQAVDPRVGNAFQVCSACTLN